MEIGLNYLGDYIEFGVNLLKNMKSTSTLHERKSASEIGAVHCPTQMGLFFIYKDSGYCSSRCYINVMSDHTVFII